MLKLLCLGINGSYGFPRSPVRKSVMLLCGIFLATLFGAQGSSVDCLSPCPSGCTCFSKNKGCVVNCTNAGLTGVPASGSLPNDKYLKEIYLDYNDITSIGANDFSTLTNLQEIHLQGNKLNSIHKESFHLPSLEVIDLSNNPITNIGVDLFEDCQNLEIVNLSRTQISSLDDDTFTNIGCLEELDLSWNNLQIITENVFKSLKCLKILKLNGNAFENVASLDFDFNQFKNLIELDLSNNKFATFQSNVLSLLTNLRKLNVANNPFECNCDLLPFREELITMENSGVELVDKNNVNCSNAPLVNILEQSSESFWCPDKLGSCYYDSEEKVKHDVLFSTSQPVADNLTCIEYCFDQNSTYGIFEDGLCMCGYKNEDPSNPCWCNSKPYADGNNMACTVPGTTSTNVVYCSTVYPINAGLTITPFDVLQAGKSKDFTAHVLLNTIVKYTWSFGDSVDTFTDTTTGLSYTNSHTYTIPGTYTLTVIACSLQAACTSISVPVEVRPVITIDDLDITCPTATTSLSSTISINGTVSMGYNAEIKWSKSPEDNVTATTDGECEPTWDFFRGRCLQTLPSPGSYATGTTTCNGGHLLSVHYPEEITQILSTHPTLSSIYVGALKNGNKYDLINGNQAYFMTNDVTDSSIGSCVVIDRTSGALKGVACSSSHSIICQQTPNTQCPHGGHYYSANNHCYKLYETTINWSDASLACQALSSQSQLAVLDSPSLATYVTNNVFGSITQPAWIGLTDRDAEGYLMWTNNRSVVNNNPVGTAPETDCITLDKTGSWTHYSCKETMFFICQYSLRESMKVPSYLAGIGRLADVGVSYTETALNARGTTPSGARILSIFPGLVIKHSGVMQKWIFKTTDLTKNYDISFQVYRPQCASGTLINPGCDGNGGRYASCSSSVTSCSALPSCNEGEESCYHTKTCLPISDPCNCNLLDTTTYPYCSTPYIGTRPLYKLQGETHVTVPAGSSGYFSVAADDISVEEGDVLAFQVFSSDEVILCNNSDISRLENALQKFQVSSFAVGDLIDTASSNFNWRNNSACYFQAVYTSPESVTLPQSLQYTTIAGTYTYELSVPESNVSKSCTITVEEDVGDIVWIYPAVQLSNGGTDTFYVAADVSTYLAFAVTRGTNLQIIWEINGNSYTSVPSSSCPSSVASEYANLCDDSNYWITNPFTSHQQTFTYTGADIPVKVSVYNSVGSQNKTLASRVFLPLSVGFNLTDFSNGYLVEINKMISFSSTVLNGNPTNFTYMVNGTMIQTSPTCTIFTHTFTTKSIWEVTLEISDGFSSTNATLMLDSRYVANVQNLALIGIPSTTTVNTAVQFQATATVNANAFITVLWEFESGSLSETMETTTTTLNVSKSHTHAMNGTYTFRLTITDDFGNTASKTQTIRMVELLPSVSLAASPTSIRTGSSIDFVATIPDLAIRDYGVLVYTFNFNDTNQEISPSKEKIHTFSTAGIYHVTVSVTNDAETVEDSVTVEVLDPITGLAIVADRVIEVNTSVTITASITTGNSVTYAFDLPDFGFSSGNTTDVVYKTGILDKTGHFNITLTAWNYLGSSTVSKEMYVLDRDTLEIIGFNHNKYQASNTQLDVAIDVLYYDHSDLILTWNFNGNIKKAIGDLTTSHTFTTAGIYNFTVTVQSQTIQTKLVTGYSTVEIQDVVSGLSVNNNGPVALASTGSATVNITATSYGSNLRYTWDYDGKVETTTSNTVTVTRSQEVTETVLVMVWNDVSSVNGTTTYKFQQKVEGLQITCLNCTTDNGKYYLQTTKTASFVASLTFGTNVTYNWNYGDTNTGVGISQTHAYVTPANYNIVLSAVNDVGTVQANFTIYVQEEITSVAINVATNPILVNNTFTLTAVPSGGTSLTYAWQDCGTCDQTHQSSTTYTTGIYNTSGKYIVSVKAYNQISFQTASHIYTVLDAVTNVSILSNLTSGKYAAIGQNYMFTAQANTDVDLLYTWVVKQSSQTMSSGSSQNFTYNFQSSLQYEVSVRVANALTNYLTSIMVDAEAEITGVSIDLDKSLPIATGVAVQITAQVTTGTGLSYKWMFKNSTGQYDFTYTTKSFPYTFQEKGDYDIILEVQNHLGTFTVNKTITIMEAVSGVEISSVVNTSYPFVAVNSTITFSANVTRGESYTTSWTIADGISSALSFTGTQLTHKFTKSGTYNITLLVQNSVSQDQYQLTIYIQGAVTTLDLVPSTNLVQTGQSVTFVANYNSGADNLVFEWTVEGSVTNGTSNTLTHLFNSAGTFTAYIKVYNHISKLTDQVDVIIEVPVSGLSMTTCNITKIVNTLVTSTATVLTGTNVTFTYKIETGTSMTVVGTGSAVSYTFTTTGVYNLYMNASNQVSQEQIQCIYTIIGPISGLAVNTSGSDFFVSYPVKLQVTGNNLVGVSYDWTFQPTNENIVTTNSLLEKTFTTSATYSYTLVVSNTINSKTITGSFTIEPLHCGVMTVTTGGTLNKIRKKSLTSTFEVTVDKLGCTAYTLSYRWLVYPISNGGTGSLGNPVTLSPSIITNTPKLLIDSSLDVGSYYVQLTTKYDNTPLYQVVTYNLTVSHSDLVAVISGGSKMKYPNSRDIIVDGSSSFDPDDKTTTLQYSWTCSVSYPLTPPVGYVDSCSSITASTSSSVTMVTSNILPGETYTLTLTVSATGRTPGTFQVEIEISSSEVPIVMISCITCVSKNSYVINAGDHVAFSGNCPSCLPSDTIYYEWSVYSVVGSTRTQMTITSDKTTTGINKSNFVITSGHLPIATFYVFKLEISRTDSSGTTLQSSSEFQLKANSLPSGGSCILATNGNVDPLVDMVEIICSGFVDPDNANGELNYKIMSYSKDPATTSQSVLIYYGTLHSPKFHLAPWPGTVRNAVQLQVSVVDEEGGEKLALDVDVQVSSTVTNGNQFGFIQTHTTTTLVQFVNDNNPTSLLQYGIALIHEMNEYSRQETLLSPPATHIDDRNTLRNRITLAVLGLPLETKYQQSQMAFILLGLTKYIGECQTSICQTWVLNEVDGLKKDMETNAFQGGNKNDFTSSILLESVSNTMDAVNAAVYHAFNISNVTSLDNNEINTYKPDISTLDLTGASVSSEKHKQDIIIRSFKFSDDIVILNLKTQLPDEEAVTIELESMQVRGKRTWTDSIEQSYSSDGCVAVLNSGMLDSMYPTRDEVFQVMMVMQQNPFTWGDNQVAVDLNTKVIAAGFTDTTGQELSVSNIPAGKKPKFIIMKNGGLAYNITDDNIIKSADYAPSSGITFASTIVNKNSAKKVIIDTSQGFGGAALHLQIRFSVVPDNSMTENATEVIKVYLGKNYEATTSKYETMKEIKIEHMADQTDHRLYTLFVEYSNFDTDSSYTVTVYNNDLNFDVNISAGVYFSTCQFFDLSSSSWDTNGCAPTDESIENYAVCECEHLTPFGGGMLAPPNVLSFADLLNLDLSTNPVVFIACSLIFVTYIVAVIICRRLDQSNLERISSIPLCGKDGSFKYEVTVITGRQPGAGTTANVGLRLYGEYGKTSTKQLEKKWAFQRNCQDTFILAHDVNLGNIERMMVWHDNSGLNPSWYLVQVIVKDLQTDCKYYFFANFWMSLEMEKGFIQKELHAAGSSEIQKFGRMFSRAVSNCMADRHLWYSVIDRPAQSRFTRVQRATCAVTILYSFMAINAMWYGLLKQEDNNGLSSFGWQEVVLSLVTNVIAFPFSLMIIWMFKRSKSKKDIFEHGNRLMTAQSIEIDYDPNLPGSFKTNDDLISCYDRESTTDSLVQATMTQSHLRRSKTLKITRQLTDDSLKRATISYDSGIDSLASESKLKRTNNPHMWSKNDITHKDETYITKNEKDSKSDRKEEVKQVADGILQYLDDVETECMMKEQQASQKRTITERASLRRTATKKTDWKEVDDILQSDNESKPRSRPLRKKDSTSTIGSYGKPTSSSSGKGYNPREDPNINGHERKLPSSGSTIIWASKLRTTSSMDSTTLNQSTMPVDGICPLEPDMGLAQQSNPEMDREEMQLLEQQNGSKSCTLPAWFVYIAYVICFILCVTSVVLVIMYGQQFGADIALQWILTLLFCIAMSFIVIEPLKAMVIAFYASSVLKKEDTTEDDAIDIQPTVDTSNEKVKENKFTPLAGFALLNAKEEGQKILRMRVMLRQFIAYMFYLWLLMTLCYVNMNYDTYLFKSSVDNTVVKTTITGTEKSFINISDVDEFWSWSQSALLDGIHHNELYSDLEFGTLLGVARLRLVRSTSESCPATLHPLHSGLDSLTNRTCYGDYGYNEDQKNYGEGWNLSSNLSWRYLSGSQTDSKTRYGYVYTYGGGGYVHNLGTTYNDSLTILQDLQNKNWIDERTRAVFIDFTMYSAAKDLTTVVNLMIEFPLTGGLNTSSDIQSQVLLRFVHDVVDPLMVCQCILFLVNIYLVCHIFNSIRDHKKEFFKDPWNWFEMLTTLMAIVVNGLYIGCVVESTTTFDDYFNNKYGFTNFETISDTHVVARYIQGILIFLLMIKIVKQLRFIKFLYIYERTLSDASGKLFGIAVMFFILFLTYGMAAYLWYGREVDGFETYWHTLTSLVGMQHGHFSFWPLLDHQPIFTHFFLYFYYAFCYGITIALILSVLNDTYRTTRSQMYFKATMDMQDYEMVEFIMKRFKLWAGLDKPKPGIRRVHFDRRQFSASSRSSRPSSRDSNLSYDPFETNPRTTSIAAERLETTWEDCLCTLERVCGLDTKEEELIKTTQKGIDEWKFQNRIKNYERELQNCSDKPPKGAPSGTSSVRSKIPRRTSTTGSEAGNKRGLGTPDARSTALQGRPLSDQGGRTKPAPKRTNSRERFSIYNFFKSVNPSKDAWK